MKNRLKLPAPAKLNLFLHITGRRDDGYHELQTLFQFLDMADELEFSKRNDGHIQLSTPVTDVAHEENLIVRAARMLQSASQTSFGAEIKIDKKLPMGGGMGGGSSDAATTLLALNHLWQINYSLPELAQIGIKLGADVPIFLFGEAAFARGIGEQFEAALPTESWYVIIHPEAHVSTGAVFNHPELPRSTAPLQAPLAKCHEMNWQKLPNDCQELVFKLYPQVAAAHQWLLQYAASKMTGTGACLFAPCSTESEAKQVLAGLPKCYRGWVAKGMNRSSAHLALAAQQEG
ncbi:MAG: 4-(cytidine 5'-diphospho)-2-C-methyl-D-erythritol kinase IspE [Idiomarinaceae bacterium HL-53]|nr:MAG: 4-(cytidine 5'-diphospho)-2-C-methyl-D-erythritol kinase IspE [Idiomarinaceae bacterium HL-53]CUS48785.1 4-diphosphocytidyl-2-C-methyl-D-erythritol kinase [Idiomarinaceae bacterium HL-53]